MSEHTKGRLEHVKDGEHIPVHGGATYSLVVSPVSDRMLRIAAGANEHDARRLAACWNVFENVRTEMVEALAGIGAMGVAADAVRRLPAMESELKAARALLREVVERLDHSQSMPEFQSRIASYLDACDTLGDGNG